jgi:hypothetical protein
MSNIFSTLVLEQNPAYVDDLEAKYNIQLPPIFKAFVQTFEFGKFNPSPQHKIKHPNKELGSIAFDLSLDEVLNVYLEQGDYYQNDKILPIITSGIYASGICLGASDNNKDTIFLYVAGIDEKLRVISPNILQFIAELKEVHWDNL